MRSYMAYSRRSPLVAGCLSGLMASPPSMVEALRRVLSAGETGIYRSEAGVLEAVAAHLRRFMVHVSEEGFWSLPRSAGPIVYRGALEDMPAEACRAGVDAVLVHSVHPLTGELRDLRGFLDGLGGCRDKVVLVVDASLSAGIVEPPALDAGFVVLYRLDKWLMGPPLVAVHSDILGRRMEADEWEASCIASSIAEVLDRRLGGGGRQRLLRTVAEISWEIDRLGLRSPTPPEEHRRAAMVTIHAGRAAMRAARLVASRGVIVDVLGPYLRIAPHADSGEESVAALLSGLAAAKTWMR